MSAAEGSAAEGPVIGRIRRQSVFRALRKPAGQGSSGPVRASFVPYGPGFSGSFPQVAYAVSARCGNAVARNRIRRRLRAIVGELAPELAVGAHLLGTGPAVSRVGYQELATAVREAVGQAQRRAGFGEAGAAR